MERFFTRCLPIAFTMFARVSEREFFPAIAVEYDSNSKFSQNVQNLGFFEKIDEFFEKKLEFLQNF